MKNQLLLCVFSMVSCAVTAQWSNTLKFETSSGYEYNIYKNPLSYSSGEDFYNEADLLVNAPYLKLILGDELSYNWKNQNLEFKGKIAKQLYKEANYANNLDIYSRLRYQAEIGERTKIELAAYFLNQDRNDFFEIDDKYRYPLPYSEYKSFGEIDCKLASNIHIAFFSNFRLRNYKEIPNVGKTSYNEYLLGINFKKRIRIKKGTYHYFYLNGEYAHRSYDKKSFALDEDSGDDIVISNRAIHWKYYRGEISYKAKFGEVIKLKPGFKYEHRNDDINTKYQYNQYTPFLGLDFEFNNSKVSFDAEKRFKAYNRTIDNQFSEPEKYKYEFWKLGIKYAHSVSNYFDLYLAGKAYLKDSNYTSDKVLSGRPYNYFKTEIGIQITL